MNYSKKVFLTLSLSLLVFESIFVYFAYHNDVDSFKENQAAKGKSDLEYLQQYVANSQTMMLQLATYIIGEERIQEDFKKGRENFLKGNFKQADVYRKKILKHIGKSWNEVQKKYNVRQLHFHIGPGDTSFLRVHKPKKFGDDLAGIRHTIVDAIKYNKEVTGFESGRVYSGLRGVVPITDGGEAIGAIETGTSFRFLLEELNDLTSIDYAVVLDLNLLKSTMWKDDYDKFVYEKRPIRNHYVESTTNPNLAKIVLKDSKFLGQMKSSNEIFHFDDGRIISVSMENLKDYRSEKNNTPGVGHLITFRDITVAHQEFRDQLERKLWLAFYVYIFLILVFYFGITLSTSKLDKIIAGQIEDLEQRNEDLKMINKAISHDLKSPLALITGYSEVALESLDEMPKGELCDGVRDNVATIHNSAIEMGRLIEDLLRYSSKGLDGMYLRETMISSVIKSAMKQLRMQLSRTGAEINIDGGESTIFCSPELITQVFTNLLSNSLKYSKDNIKPIINISTSQTVQHVVVTVEDNGIGMTKDRIPKIFDRFVRVHDENYDVEGHGIGLNRVKIILTDHKAEIEVESEPGVGTIFTIKFKKKLS
jgi:signal transduction histidine kinase